MHTVTAVQDNKWTPVTNKTTAKVAPTQDVSKTNNHSSLSPPRAKETNSKTGKPGVVFDEMAVDKNDRPVGKGLIVTKEGKDGQVCNFVVG